MKIKFLALTLAASLSSASILPCMAEEAASEETVAEETAEEAVTEEATEETSDEITEVNYGSIDTSVYDGEWVRLKIGYDLYLPKDWTENEDAEKDGVVFAAVSPDEVIDGSYGVLMISAEENDGYLTDRDAIYEAASYGDTYDIVRKINVNGIEAVYYGIDEDQMAGYIFLDESGNIITIAVIPGTAAEFIPTAENILLSVSPSEDETAAEAVTEASAETSTESSAEDITDTVAEASSEAG